MDHVNLLPYTVALVAMTAAPGPLMALLVVRALGADTRGVLAFGAGLCLGDVLAVCAVALGIGVWADGAPTLMSLAKYLGVAYLLWVAVNLWNSRAGEAKGDPSTAGAVASFGAGLALCLGNPATLLINMLLLPIVAPHGFSGPSDIVVLAAVTLGAVGAVYFGTIFLARQLSGRIASPDSNRLLSRLSAGGVAAASLWMLAA